MSVVYALESAAIAMPTGEVVIIKEGDRYSTDHPAVKRCPGFFTSDERVGNVHTPAESTTAIPGDRRHVRR